MCICCEAASRPSTSRWRLCDPPRWRRKKRLQTTVRTRLLCVARAIRRSMSRVDIVVSDCQAIHRMSIERSVFSGSPLHVLHSIKLNSRFGDGRSQFDDHVICDFVFEGRGGGVRDKQLCMMVALRFMMLIGHTVSSSVAVSHMFYTLGTKSTLGTPFNFKIRRVFSAGWNYLVE
jgi:hypothetical protein